jgi:hypothetical protein
MPLADSVGSSARWTIVSFVEKRIYPIAKSAATWLRELLRAVPPAAPPVTQRDPPPDRSRAYTAPAELPPPFPLARPARDPARSAGVAPWSRAAYSRSEWVASKELIGLSGFGCVESSLSNAVFGAAPRSRGQPLLATMSRAPRFWATRSKLAFPSAAKRTGL